MWIEIVEVIRGRVVLFEELIDEGVFEGFDERIRGGEG
jgi:hypothetical protein